MLIKYYLSYQSSGAIPYNDKLNLNTLYAEWLQLIVITFYEQGTRKDSIKMQEIKLEFVVALNLTALYDRRTKCERSHSLAHLHRMVRLNSEPCLTISLPPPQIIKLAFLPGD